MTDELALTTLEGIRTRWTNQSCVIISLQFRWVRNHSWMGRITSVISDPWLPTSNSLLEISMSSTLYSSATVYTCQDV